MALPQPDILAGSDNGEDHGLITSGYQKSKTAFL
jgi:hypothetical protein